MRKLKQQNGITLVALIITIIILLILAGISIASLTQTGLFAKAKEAKQKTENAQEEENAILVNYLEQIDAITGGTTPATWTWSDTDNDGTKSIGDIVTYSSGERFYIISTDGENYALLAEKNINTTTMSQSDAADTVEFSSTNYWSSETSYPLDLNNYASTSINSTDVIAKAKAYGAAKGGTGRLMSLREFTALGGTIGNTSSCPSWINSKSFWIGSASDPSSVGCVWGLAKGFNYDPFGDRTGIRPVIEISKSLIS